MRVHYRSALLAAACVIAGPLFAQEKTSVTVAAPWEVASYDTAVSGFAIQKLEIMENLVDADENGVLRPGLSTEWMASEDGLTWTFKLREGVVFHDDTAFTPAAAATVLNRSWEHCADRHRSI